MKVRSARVSMLLVARTHTPASAFLKGTKADDEAATSTFFSSVQVPLPSLSTSNVMVVGLSAWLAIHAQRLSHPLKRNGSDGTPALISSFIHTEPPAVVGPTWSGWSSEVNQRLEFDWPEPPMEPFCLRLFRNSFWAESSQPKTRRLFQRVKSPMTLRYAPRGAMPAELVVENVPGKCQNMPCMVIRYSLFCSSPTLRMRGHSVFHPCAPS